MFLLQLPLLVLLQYLTKRYTDEILVMYVFNHHAKLPRVIRPFLSSCKLVKFLTLLLLDFYGHTSINDAAKIEPDLLHFLGHNNHLNNTLLIVMGDHGLQNFLHHAGVLKPMLQTTGVHVYSGKV